MKHYYSKTALKSARKALSDALNHTTAYYDSLDKDEQKFYRTMLFKTVYEFHYLMMRETLLYNWNYKTAQTSDDRHKAFLKIVETRKEIHDTCDYANWMLKSAFSNL